MFRLRLQHRVASAVGCPLCPYTLSGSCSSPLPPSQSKSTCILKNLRRSTTDCFLEEKLLSPIFLLIGITSTVNFSKMLTVTLRSKMLRSVWRDYRGHCFLGKGSWETDSLQGNCRSPVSQSFQMINKLNLYIVNSLYLINILIT